MPGLPDRLAMSHGTNGPVAYEDVRDECFLDRERQGMLRTDRRIGELMSRHGWSMAVRWLLPYAHSLGLPVRTSLRFPRGGTPSRPAGYLLKTGSVTKPKKEVLFHVKHRDGAPCLRPSAPTGLDSSARRYGQQWATHGQSGTPKPSRSP